MQCSDKQLREKEFEGVCPAAEVRQQELESAVPIVSSQRLHSRLSSPAFIWAGIPAREWYHLQWVGPPACFITGITCMS